MRDSAAISNGTIGTSIVNLVANAIGPVDDGHPPMFARSLVALWRRIRGEIGVILVNLSNEPFVVENGERIAQLIIAKHERAEWQETIELSATSRGEGGFGSTGVK